MTATDSSPHYQPGDRVRVRVDSPPGHYRTPTYIQGKTGRVVGLCGVFPNPELLAHGDSGLPRQPLYRVEFPQSEVWSQYRGPAADKVLVDIYQHWLSPADS
jgi:hypothetical protein